MEEYNLFYIQKTPQAFDDTLMVFGLATVVQQLLQYQGNGTLTIVDNGASFTISVDPPVLAETIEKNIGLIAPRPALATAKTKLPDDIRVDNYEVLREEVQSYFAIPVAERREGKGTPPRKEWDVYRAINPASLHGYNNLMTDWHKARTDAESLFILLDLYAVLPNDFDTATERWKALDKKNGWKITPDATKQQIYNPDSGKGQNKPKADGLSIGNIKNFWLSEWLKAIGFFEVALTKQLKGVKDRKTLVLAPREFTFEEHRHVMANFTDTMRLSETPIKFDVLAAIRYTRELLHHIIERTPRHHQQFKHVNPKQHLASGFHTAFYKNMGNAVATMNLSFIALPGWVDVQSPDEVPMYKALLDELEKIVSQFDEGHSDTVTLLQHLRDFVSGDDLKALFRFTNAFSAYLIGKRESNQYAVQFTTDFIERIVMNIEKPLTLILASEGFQNIAYAIRQATVTAQYRKKQKDNKYQVRYGLGQDLARKARYPQDFIVALSDFLHKYNAENVSVMRVHPAPYRRNIQTSDIDQIVALIDEYGSETVANLLIAYGHARIPREEGFSEEPLTEQENE